MPLSRTSSTAWLSTDANAHVDPAAVGRELDRVRDEVVEELGDARPIPRDEGHGARGEGECDLLGLGLRPGRLDAFGGDRGEVEAVDVEDELAGLHLRDEEQVADEVEEPLRVALDDAEELALLVRQLARLAVEQELDVAPDRRQRRAQLVRHERDELVLQPVELAAGARSAPNRSRWAASANARASCSAASRRSRSASARLRSVMSCPIAETPTTLPDESRMGE